jgi:hypothetical protein
MRLRFGYRSGNAIVHYTGAMHGVPWRQLENRPVGGEGERIAEFDIKVDSTVVTRLKLPLAWPDPRVPESGFVACRGCILDGAVARTRGRTRRRGSQRADCAE